MNYYYILISLFLIINISSYESQLGVDEKSKSKSGEKHKEHDIIPVYVNKVGPYNNPTTTYNYYSLPYCSKKKKGNKKKQNIGETLIGDRKEEAAFEINFGVPITWRSVCKTELTRKDILDFVDAIENDYFFEMFIEDLPMWGYVGEIVGEGLFFGQGVSHVYLYPHLIFTIGINDNKIVSANVTTCQDRKFLLSTSDPESMNQHIPTEIDFTYEVRWVNEPNLKWENRMSRYVDSTFIPKSFEIHWLSIINSFVLVLLLTAFLAIILMKVLKNDFSEYMEVGDDELGEEDGGWKLIRGDVFRPPKGIAILSACLGVGAQLTIIIFLLLIFSLLGFFQPTKRGAILTSFIILYAFTSFFSGYVSCRFYRMFSNIKWVWVVILTAFLFPAPLFCIFLYVNSIAMAEKSSIAIPFWTLFTLICLFIFISFPLTVVGGIVGRRTGSNFDPPCRTNKVPREIPRNINWFRKWPTQLFIAGFLPFSAIYIELQYIFASLWGHSIYTLFGILFVAFFMLMIVTMFINIALLYFQLQKEDYNWWWRSWLNGGATGVFIYAHCFIYFFHQSEMSGFFQGSFFFGYMAIISYATFLMLGFIGFFSAFSFNRYIYSALKFD